MKTLPLVAFFALLASAAAHAQLDHILAPVSASMVAAKLDPVASAPGDSQDPAAKAVDPAAQTHATLTGDQVIDEVQKQLVSYFGIKGDLRLSIVRGWTPVQLPGKDFTLSIIDYPPEGVTSTFGLRFKVTSGTAPVGEWQINFTAQLWQSVWVTQGRLDRGQALDRSALNSQKVDVLHEKQTLIPDDVDPEGLDVAQSIGAGCAISKQDVIERPLIHRGDVVEVVAIHGALDIHMKALALEDGGVHALIKMRNLDSSKDFNAQIMNENEVTVHF